MAARHDESSPKRQRHWRDYGVETDSLKRAAKPDRLLLMPGRQRVGRGHQRADVFARERRRAHRPGREREQPRLGDRRLLVVRRHHRRQSQRQPVRAQRLRGRRLFDMDANHRGRSRHAALLVARLDPAERGLPALPDQRRGAGADFRQRGLAGAHHHRPARPDGRAVGIRERLRAHQRLGPRVGG